MTVAPTMDNPQPTTPGIDTLSIDTVRLLCADAVETANSGQPRNARRRPARPADPRSPDEERATLDAGYDPTRTLTTTYLVRGDGVYFAATEVTDGSLLPRVRFEPHRIVTHSLSMRSRSRTVRHSQGYHDPSLSTLVNFAPASSDV